MLTPAESVERTQTLIKNYADKYPAMAPIRLRDIRALSKVTQNPEVFSDKIPVYFRVDLLRLIIALHILSNHEVDYFVYADLDMKPLTKKQLFDNETLQNLQKYSIVMARGGCLGFENGFQIISNHKKHLLEAIDWMLVELNIRRAYNALRGDFYNVNGRQPHGPMEPLQQIVYDSYPAMFAYFYHLEGIGRLDIMEIDMDDNGRLRRMYEVYDKEIHGLEYFGLRQLSHDYSFFYKGREYYVSRSKIVPTKKVPLPPAGHNYN